MTLSFFLVLTFASSAAAMLFGCALISAHTDVSLPSALLGATLAIAVTSALYAWASA